MRRPGKRKRSNGVSRRSSNGKKTANRSTTPEISKWLKQLRSRDALKKKAAVGELCALFEPLVQSLARQYAQSVIGAEHNDLEQVARLGLVEACATYDTNRGTFHTHAQWQVRGALARYVRCLENPVRLPTNLMHALPKLRRMVSKLSQQYEREPSIAELSIAMQMPEESIMSMLTYEETAFPLNELKRTGHYDSIMWNEPWSESFAAPTASPEELLIAKEEAAVLVDLAEERKARAR